MSKTYSVLVAKPVEYARVEITLDDDVTLEDVEMEAFDYADHLDATGKLEWDLPDWTIEIVDIQEVTKEALI